MIRGGLLLAGLLAALAGCRPCELHPPVRSAAPALTLTKRGGIDIDVSSLSTQPAKFPPARPEHYRSLSSVDCRALAIANTPLANDLEAHPANNSPLHAILHRAPEIADQSRLVRGYAADELRNRAAAAALEDYYRLATAEGQFDLAMDAHSRLSAHREAAQKAIDQGLKDRGDVNAIRRQLLEMDSQIAKLDAGIGALNASLARRLGLNANDAPIWPAERLCISTEVPTTSIAVTTAMTYRPDLNLIRTLLGNDNGSGELANSVLTGINPLLGNQPPTHPLAILFALISKDGKREDAKLRRQLIGILLSRERQAEAEVHAALATLRGARASATAKAAEMRNLIDRVADLEKREAAGQQVTLELVTARLDLLKVRGELVQLVAEWHIADVKLRQATGMLVRE